MLGCERTAAACARADAGSTPIATHGWYLGIARVDGTLIATMAFPRVGDRAYYLYGALLRDEKYKHHYGSHAVMAAMLKALQADGARFVDMWGVVESDDTEADPSWKGFSDFKRTFGGTRAIRAVARIPLCRGYGPRSRTYIGCQR